MVPGGLEAPSRGRSTSNVNGTTACMSHVGGKTGARQFIEGSTEYGAYSWAISGWTWNSGLSLSVASWAIAAEEKINIDPAVRVNCKDFCIVFLNQPGRLCLREDSLGLWIQQRGDKEGCITRKS